MMYTNVDNCDSIVTLDLTINYSDVTTTSITACNSYTWNGQVYDSTAVYSQLLQTVHGCDSTAWLDLTINVSDTASSTHTACDSYDWNGITYTTSGAYTQTLPNIHGCDSVHTLGLTILYSTVGSSSVTSPFCDTYTWEGQTITTSGVLTHTYAGGAVNGCDSTHTLTVTINNSNTGSSSVTACDDLSLIHI